MKKAIVTGHSQGLGAAIAAQLHAQGFELLLLSRKSRDPHEYRSANIAATAIQVQIDLGDTQDLQAWLSTGELRNFVQGAETAILVNNAGIIGPVGAPGTQDPAGIAQAVALNISASLILCNAFVAATRNTPDRRVAHISSGAGRRAIAGWSIYGATKAALDHHARIVAGEQIPNLRISSIAPGVVDTNMQAEIRASSSEHFPGLESFRQLKLQGQLTQPNEAAAKLADYLLGQHFGKEAVSDIREV